MAGKIPYSADHWEEECSPALGTVNWPASLESWPSHGAVTGPLWPGTNPACPADLKLVSPWCWSFLWFAELCTFKGSLFRMTPIQVIYPARESGAVTRGSPRSHQWPGSFTSQQPAGMGWPPSLFPFPFPLALTALPPPHPIRFGVLPGCRSSLHACPSYPTPPPTPESSY